MASSRSSIEINPKLTPNALKAILEYSAIPVLTSTGATANALTQGAGQINGGGAVMLAWVDHRGRASWIEVADTGYDTITPTTESATGITPGRSRSCGAARKLSGANLMTEQRPAWGANIVWGEGLGGEDDNIVWGNNFSDDDNIVWGNALRH